jgi:predicted DCC family thiol-disulfide oxidoreductase YuxK
MNRIVLMIARPPPLRQSAIPGRTESVAKARKSGYEYAVNCSFHVASPPPKALLLYDGDCEFCASWVRRWRRTTGDRIDYLPFQDPCVAAQFPELPAARLDSSVQLIQQDGTVCGGAEAVFRVLSFTPRRRWLLNRYQHSRVFARLSEWGYRCVAGNRRFFSILTRFV